MAKVCVSAVSVSLKWSPTWFRCHTVVRTSRGEVPLPVDTETRLWGLSRAVLCGAAALYSHQGISWIEKLSIGHRLEWKNEIIQAHLSE